MDRSSDNNRLDRFELSVGDFVSSESSTETSESETQFCASTPKQQRDISYTQFELSPGDFVSTTLYQKSVTVDLAKMALDGVANSLHHLELSPRDFADGHDESSFNSRILANEQGYRTPELGREGRQLTSSPVHHYTPVLQESNRSLVEQIRMREPTWEDWYEDLGVCPTNKEPDGFVKRSRREKED